MRLIVAVSTVAESPALVALTPVDDYGRRTIAAATTASSQNPDAGIITPPTRAKTRRLTLTVLGMAAPLRSTL